MRTATIFLAVSLLLAAAGCGDTAPKRGPGATVSTAADPSPLTGRIVFRRFTAGSETQAALFTSEPDGTDEVQLTRPGENEVDDEPSWSPDGRRIVFSRNTGTGTEREVQRIFTISPDGSDLRALSPNFEPSTKPLFLTGADQGPVYSPDGTMIAFAHVHGHIAVGPEHGLPDEFGQIAFAEIFVMDADGSHRRQVTHHPAYSGDSGPEVAWSPDGTRLVFGRVTAPGVDRDACRSLFVVRVDGSGERRLTPCSLGAGGAPDWSADGRIAFRAVSDEERGIGNFFLVDPEHGGPTQVTHFENTVISHKVGFSPDGKRIVFSQEIDGTNEVYTSATDGSDVRRVTRTPESDSSPDWGPAR